MEPESGLSFRLKLQKKGWELQRVVENGQAGLRRSLKAQGAGSSLPVYHQLSSILRQQIKDGIYSSDKAMPSEMQLSQTYDVSRVTVRRALETLENEGFIVRRHGVGTFAAPRAQKPDSKVDRVSGLVENLITLGLETTAQLLAYVPDAPTPPVVLQALRLEPGDTTLCIERLRFYNNQPLSLSRVYVPHEFAHLAPEHLIDDRPIIRLLESGGLRPDRAEQTISAIPADDEAAEKLNVGISMPLLRMRRTVFNSDGCPLEHQVGLYNPDQYEYHMMLTRDNSSARPQWRHIG